MPDYQRQCDSGNAQKNHERRDVLQERPLFTLEFLQHCPEMRKEGQRRYAHRVNQQPLPYLPGNQCAAERNYAYENQNCGIRRCHQGQDEYEDCQCDHCQQPSGKPLSVKHENEADVDQGRTCFLLRQDDDHRENDDECHRKKVLEPCQSERCTAHHECQQQGSGDFRHLGRLEPHRAESEP